MAADYGVAAVADVGVMLKELLARALVVKQSSTIDPALHKADFAELFERLQSIFAGAPSPDSRKHVIETAVRDTFNRLLVSCTSTIKETPI